MLCVAGSGVVHARVIVDVSVGVVYEKSCCLDDEAIKTRSCAKKETREEHWSLFL